MKKIMGIKEDLESIRSDERYVTSNYGRMNDFTGSGAEDDYLNDLLANPSKKTAYSVYLDMLQNVFEVGYGDDGVHATPLPVANDTELQRIADKYSLESCNFDDEE